MTLTPTNSHGGASGGGAVTVADGADVTEGAVADAAIITNTTGTVSGKLRGIVALLAGTLRVGGDVASDAPVTANPQLDGGRASTAVPTAVSTDGDSVALWLTRNGAAVVDGGVAAGATDSGNPVKGGGVFTTTPPTLTNGQRGNITLDARGSQRVILFDGANQIDSLTGTDGSSSAFRGQIVNGLPMLYNGATVDKQRANDAQTLLASAARTVATSSADQTNYNGLGVLIVVNTTVEGAATLTLTVQGKDSISSNYYDLTTGIIVYTAAADTPPITRAVAIYPGVLTADAIGAGNANLISQKSVILPRIWRITITPADATTTTYSVSGATML